MKKQLLSLAAISLLTLSAQASDVPYSYADIAYNSFDEFDGFTIGGSFDFGNNFYALGDYASLSADEDGIDVDLSRFQIGVGYNYEISPNTDLIAELSLVNADFEVSGFGQSDSDDESGYAVGLGVRSMISSNVELNAKVQYDDVFEETGFELGGMYYLDNGFGFGGSYESISDDLDGFSLRARYKF